MKVLDRFTGKVLSRPPMHGDIIVVESSLGRQTYIYEEGEPPIPIENITVIGDLSGFHKKENEYVVRANSAITVRADVNMPDGFIKLPMKDSGSRQMIPFVGEVRGGVLTINSSFPSKGYWLIDTELLNSEADTLKFVMEPLVFTSI